MPGILEPDTYRLLAAIPVSGRYRAMRDPVPGGVIPLSLDLMRHLGPALDGAPGGGGNTMNWWRNLIG